MLNALSMRLSCERPMTAPVYDDAVIAHWAAEYSARPWLASRMTFEAFLALRTQTWERIEEGSAMHALDQAVARLRAQVEALERTGASSANGRVVEKLRHRRHPSGRRSSFEVEAR